MRVITGAAKGHKLKAPKGLSTRPMLDRVKESLFSVLEGLFGLTWSNSWPLFIIISGITMAIRPIAARRFNADRENHHGK